MPMATCHPTGLCVLAAVAAATATPAVAPYKARPVSAAPTVAMRHVSPSTPVVVDRPAGAKRSVASMWREIQGGDDWAGLVQPLHSVLRDEIVRYGELVAATYKAFDLDPASGRYLNCKHGKHRMLEGAGMGGAGYDVTRYVYAAPNAKAQSRWIGYVAVASDETARKLGRRDIVVAFRGTVTASEWAANLQSALAPARFDAADPRPDVKVESGFLSLYTSDDASGKSTCGSCRNQLLAELARLVGKHKHEDISITLAGHSMGSSLALLLGYDLAELGLNSDGAGRAVPVTVYSFAGPRVGNARFKNRCDELGVKVLRVANVRDPVTKLPGVFLNERLPWSRGACYAHVGVEVAIDFFPAGDPASVHDLEAYLGRLKKRPKVSKATAKKLGLEKSLEIWRWQMAAMQFGGLVQALGI